MLRGEDSGVVGRLTVSFVSVVSRRRRNTKTSREWCTASASVTTTQSKNLIFPNNLINILLRGNNCERCKDFYQDVPWRPATGKMKNECKKCNCNEHTDKCHYDSRVFAASGQTSGGVCEDCKHNTEGKNCDMCIAGYYQVNNIPRQAHHYFPLSSGSREADH